MYKVKFTKYVLIYCIVLKDTCVIAVNWLCSRSFAPFYDNNFDLHKRTRVLEDLAKWYVIVHRDVSLAVVV